MPGSLVIFILAAIAILAQPRLGAPQHASSSADGSGERFQLTHPLKIGGSKPPRGYCMRISRAVLPSSRCYKHLIQIDGQQLLERAALGGNGRRKRRKSFAQDVEELVYVRFETIGTSLKDLGTRPINERLLVGIMDQLLSGGEGANYKKQNRGKSSKSPNVVQTGSQTGATQMMLDGSEAHDVMAQILDSASENEAGKKVAQKCRLSIERFLCRLVYPSCHFRRADVSALVRPPCREDCLLLRDVLCSNLNWFKFSRALNRALNVTLMSAINALDLAVEGDAHLEAIESPSPPPPPQAKSEFSINYNQSDRIEASPHLGQHFVPALGYDLNSSLHFYWPHEHSMARCESLPPLRPIQAKGQAYSLAQFGEHKPQQQKTGLRTNKENEAYLAHSKAQNQQKHPRWPICSNAHLTKTYLLALPNIGQRRKDSPLDMGTRDGSAIKESRSEDCLRSNDGVDYSGTRNYTKTGLSCQSWSKHWPHMHKRYVTSFTLIELTIAIMKKNNNMKYSSDSKF